MSGFETSQKSKVGIPCISTDGATAPLLSPAQPSTIMSRSSRLQPVTNAKGRDLPMWLLWVNIDYTAASQLSGTTRAEDNHVLWDFFFVFFSGSSMCPNPRLGPALGPAGALLSAAHISMRVSALGLGFSELLLVAVGPPQRRVCSVLPKLPVLGLPQGTGCARIWVCALGPTPAPNAPRMSSDWPCPAHWKLSVDFLCWQVRRDRLCGVERLALSGLVTE